MEFAKGPLPGDIYKEWTYHHIGHADIDHAIHFAEVDPKARHPIADKLRAEHPTQSKRYLVIDDLEKAIRAEIAIEYWGGHIGTIFEGFKVNNHPWLPIPQPIGTPTQPEKYHRTVLGGLVTPIPLEQLKTGVNCFQFGASNQIDYSFDCGFFWIYSFTVRIYYTPDKRHTFGHVISPKAGTILFDHPTIHVEAETSQVSQIDFLAYYRDFNWEGDGIYHRWHAQRCYGTLRGHIGQKVTFPYSLTWDTTRIPDQTEPIQVAAQITAPDGTKHMTPAMMGLEFVRKKHSLLMYEPVNVPENFSVRIGQRKTCDFIIRDNLKLAKKANLVLSTWSGAHADEIGLNNRILVNRVGKVHDLSFDRIRVPCDLLKPGINTFFIFSNTEEHAAEINWPGPALFVEYDKHEE